jgi:hypothetical protein
MKWRLMMAAIHGLLESYKKLDPSYQLYTPAVGESGEADFLRAINGLIAKLDKPIDIKIKGKLYENICGVNKVFGVPKADLVLVSLKKGKLRDTCYISHKKGKTARGFAQWSGMSQRSGSAIANHPLVKEFIKDILATKRQTFDNKSLVRSITIMKTFSIMKDIVGQSDTLLKMYAMYGPKYGQATGIDNVDYIMQGDIPELEKTGSFYTLKMNGSTTAFIHKNGELPPSDYIPAMFAWRKGAHSDRSDYGTGARLVIQPRGGRTPDFIIDPRGNLVAMN